MKQVKSVEVSKFTLVITRYQLIGDDRGLGRIHLHLLVVGVVVGGGKCVM